MIQACLAGWCAAASSLEADVDYVLFVARDEVGPERIAWVALRCASHPNPGTRR